VTNLTASKPFRSKLSTIKKGTYSLPNAATKINSGEHANSPIHGEYWGAVAGFRGVLEILDG
jgi:hypothetical protein